MLRTLFVIAIIVVGIRYSFKGPFYALLFYLWIAYFRPESWLWIDFVSLINLSLVVGVFVLLSTVLSRQKLRGGPATTLMLLFLGQSLLATLASPEIAYSWPLWLNFAKSTIISCLIVGLVTDERRFRLALLVIAMSLGLEGAKQGWAQLVLNPGGQNNNTIPLLGDNNGVAVGMLMLVPMLLALAGTATGRFERWMHRFVAVGVLYRAISTYSRGGFVSCGVLLLHYVARSRQKAVAIIGVAVVAGLIYPVLPDAFWERMSTIQAATGDTESADESIRSRLHFWNVALAMAADRPLTGVGHNAFNVMYDRYDSSGGEYGAGRSVHNSWLGIAAELGYSGFVIFALLMAFAFRACLRARSLAKRDPKLQHFGQYAAALEAALLVFAVGGTFVPWQYCEMLWHTLALSGVLNHLVNEHAAANATVPLPIPTPVAAVSPILRGASLAGQVARLR
jgi:probable O-glycosylation ligase (exosortase A-associated)